MCTIFSGATVQSLFPKSDVIDSNTPSERITAAARRRSLPPPAAARRLASPHMFFARTRAGLWTATRASRTLAHLLRPRRCGGGGRE